MSKLDLNHQEDCFDEEQTHKTYLSCIADINLLEHPLEAELLEHLDQKDLEVLQCKDNSLPRGLAPLEELFDFNDVARKPKKESTETDVEECNIGSVGEPKMMMLSKTLPPPIKQKYIEIFKEFKDVFSWGYEDLKSYDTNIIQHKIPLKENQKPFKKKQIGRAHV